MAESKSEIADIKAQLEKLKQQLQFTANFALRASFEHGAYEDVPSKSLECPICSGVIAHPSQCVKISEDFWHTGKIKRIECPHCDVVFGPLSVINKSPERLSSDYEMLYSLYAEGATTEYQKRAFFALNPEKEKNYLNFACGNWAQGCSELSELGWQVYGYEPHLAYQHPKIMRNLSDLNTLVFDGIFTHNFIEHLQHPIAQFQRWNAMLKVGGCLVHSSPCFEWLYDYSNFHLFFFLGKSLSLLAEKTGFKIVNQIDFNTDNKAIFTRIVVFQKVRECAVIDDRLSAPPNQDYRYGIKGYNNMNTPTSLQTNVGKFYGQFEPPVDKFIFERYFPDFNIGGVFVECGAFDGLTECSCKFFEESMNWIGFNFEPLPWVFEKLVKNRPNSTNLNLALSSQRGVASFVAVNHPTFGLDCTNGSLSHATPHRKMLDDAGCSYQEIEVRLINWRDFVLEQKITHVDLFVLDVEGHELSVLEGMQGCEVLPDIMCVEFGHLGLNIVRNKLELMGYVYDITSNANAFFIRKDKLGLFAFRRNVIGRLEADTADSIEDSNIEKKELDFLRARVKELVELNEAIISSKGWRLIERLRALKKSIFG